jgi:undecaprenyl-diphosphatase
MSFIEAIILGIIQGLTEFLPVSSSGHIELGKEVLGSVPEEGMLMTVVLHFATALSTIVIFRKDIIEIFNGLFKFKNNQELRFSLMIILSMIPAALVGVFLEDEIDAFFSGNILVVGIMLILTGGLLFLADQAKTTEGRVTPVKAVVIGIAQAIAILPGISRSGATIGTSVLLGIDRTRAARFSFLMVVPLIFGAMAVKTKGYLEVKQVEDQTNSMKAAELIIDDLKEDYPFVQEPAVKRAIIYKEAEWQRIRKEGDIIPYHDIGLNDMYERNLRHSAKLDDNQIEVLMTDDLAKVRPLQSTSIGILIAGFLAAFITGLFACTWMIKIVKRSKLKYFAFYCFAVGITAIVWSFIK